MNLALFSTVTSFNNGSDKYPSSPEGLTGRFAKRSSCPPCRIPSARLPTPRSKPPSSSQPRVVNTAPPLQFSPRHPPTPALLARLAVQRRHHTRRPRARIFAIPSYSASSPWVRLPHTHQSCRRAEGKAGEKSCILPPKPLRPLPHTIHWLSSWLSATSTSQLRIPFQHLQAGVRPVANSSITHATSTAKRQLHERPAQVPPALCFSCSLLLLRNATPDIKFNNLACSE